MENLELKSALDAMTEKLEAGRKADADKLEAKMSDIANRVSDIETGAQFPGTVAAKAADKEMEHKSLMDAYIRNSTDSAKKAAYEAKAVTVAGLTTAVPRVVSNDIIAAARKISPFADLVLRKNGISPEYSQLLSNGATYELVGESTTRGTQNADLSTAKPIWTELSSVVRVSAHAIEDFNFDVISEISTMIAADFGVGLEEYLVKGTGTGVQNAGVLLGGNAVASAGEDATVDDVLGLIKSVKVGDAQMGAFVVSPEIYELLSNEKIAGQRIIDIKDSVDVIRGKKVFQSEWLPEGTPALFGNFARGFLAGTHIAGMSINVNPYKTVGFVDIEARLRFGSCVLHTGAYSKLTVA